MRGFPRLVGGLLMVCVAALSLSADARADFINPSFEATPEFSGWQRIGDTNVVTAAFGIPPTQGLNQALITTRANSAVPTNVLESFLGVAPGTLSGLAGGQDVIEGSAIRQTGILAVPGPGVAAFDVNFLTNEIPGTPFSDFSFVITMSSSTGTSAMQVVSASASGFIAAPLTTGFLQQTGYRTYFVPVPTAGTFNFAIGVVDVGDALLDSAILIDNIRLVPEPRSAILMGLGTLGMFGYGWWRRRAPAESRRPAPRRLPGDPS